MVLFKRNIVLALSLCFLTFGFMGAANAADCVVHYKRTACKGQEAISYKKCGGEQECDKNKALAKTEEACLKAALKSCKNSRFDITKWKVITAKFKGKQLVGGYTPDGTADPKGLNFCAGDRPDLNKCD